MIRYSSGSRGQSAKLLIVGSKPARISIGSLRLVGQDTSLSSWKYGFESRRDHHNLEREPGRSGDRLLSGLYRESVSDSNSARSAIWVSRLAAMAADCKSAGFTIVGSSPTWPTNYFANNQRVFLFSFNGTDIFSLVL